MPDAILAAALLNFAGAAGFNTMLIGREKCSPLSNVLFWPLVLAESLRLRWHCSCSLKSKVCNMELWNFGRQVGWANASPRPKIFASVGNPT